MRAHLPPGTCPGLRPTPSHAGDLHPSLGLCTPSLPPHPVPAPRFRPPTWAPEGRTPSAGAGGEAGGGGPSSSPDGFPGEEEEEKEEAGATAARLSGAAGRRKVRDSAERSAARGRRRRGLERLLREPMAARWLRRWQRRGTRRPRPPGPLVPQLGVWFLHAPNPCVSPVGARRRGVYLGLTLVW